MFSRQCKREDELKEQLEEVRVALATALAQNEAYRLYIAHLRLKAEKAGNPGVKTTWQNLGVKPCSFYGGGRAMVHIGQRKVRAVYMSGENTALSGLIFHCCAGHRRSCHYKDLSVFG
jgi:hypothetical protein